MRAPIPPPTETGAHTHMAVGVPRTGGRAPAHRRHHADGNAGRRSAPRDAMNAWLSRISRGRGFRSFLGAAMVRSWSSANLWTRKGSGLPIVPAELQWSLRAGLHLTLACDAMEPVRQSSTTSCSTTRLATTQPPRLRGRRDGQCRLLERRASELAETLPTWARHIAPRRRVAKAGDAPHRRKAPRSRAHRRQDPTS